MAAHRKKPRRSPQSATATSGHPGAEEQQRPAIFEASSDAPTPQSPLSQREEQYRAIFEASSDGLGITDAETGIVLEANPAFCRMHGYDQMVGMHPTTFIHPDSHHLFEEFVRTVRAGGEFRCRARDVRRDGSVFDVEVRGRSLTYRGKPALLGVVRDVTAQVHGERLLEERVELRTRELAALLDVSRNVSSNLGLQPLLKVILEQVRVVTDYDRGTFAILDEDEDEIEVLAVGEWTDTPIVGLKEGTRIPVAAAPDIWALLKSGEPVVIDDVQGDSEAARSYRGGVGPAAGGVRSWMGVPLMYRDGIIGMLALSKATPHSFTPQQARLACAFADQAAIAVENARLYEQAKRLAALEERQRLARELHDSVSQALYGIALGSRTARKLLDADPKGAAEAVEYVLSLAEAGLTEMRAMIFELRPESLEREGLVAALEKRIDAICARSDIRIDWIRPEEPKAPLEVKEAVYRIVQEALQNVVKHAQATQVTVELITRPGFIAFRVSDNGTGFDPDQPFSGHLGLKSMRERAANLRGSIEIESKSGAGTTVRGYIPLDPA